MLRGIPTLLIAKVTNLPYVQVATYGSITDNASGSVSFSKPPTNGNLLILCTTTDDNINTPSTGGTWTKNVEQNVSADSCIFSKISNGTEQTVNVTMAGADAMCLIYFEITGFTTFDKSDTADINPGSATIKTGNGTPTTTAANEILVAVAGLSNSNNTASGPVTSWTNGFINYGYALANASTSGTGVEMSVALLKVSAIGSYSSVATLTHVTQPINDCNGLMGTYK